jgi:hypothetical protein
MLLLSNSMEQSPSWETNSSSASQEIPHILCNPKVRYRIHKCPSSVPILSQINPIYASFHFVKIHLNIILPSTPSLPRGLFLSGFPTNNPVYTSPLPHTCYMPRPSHSSWFDHPNNRVSQQVWQQIESLSDSWHRKGISLHFTQAEALMLALLPLHITWS